MSLLFSTLVTSLLVKLKNGNPIVIIMILVVPPSALAPFIKQTMGGGFLWPNVEAGQISSSGDINNGRDEDSSKEN